MSPGAGDGLALAAVFGLHPLTFPPRPLAGLAAFNVHPASTGVLRLGFAFGPSRRPTIPPVIRPLLTSPRRAAPSRAPPSLPTREHAKRGPGIPGHPQRPPRVRPATFIAHPPRLRNGPLMTSGFASWCRLARTAPPSTRSETRPQTIPPRHVFLGSRLRTPASSPPSLTTEQLPSACGWCHQPPQGTRTPELLVMSRAHRTCQFPGIRLKQALVADRRAEAPGRLLAVKIRCRNRRTSASARRQSTWRQRSASSSGPLTTTSVSSLSFGSGISVIFFSTGSPDRVSTLSSPGTRLGIRPVIRDRQPGGASHHVPVSCRLSAAGIRFSVIPFPPRDRLSSRSAHRPKGRTSDGVTAFRTHELRPGWVPPITRGQMVLIPAGSPPRPAPAASSDQSLNPATTSHHARLSFTGHQQGFTHVHPSGLPLAHAPGMEPAALRLPPELRTPPSPATHVRGRDRPSSTDLELPLNSHPSISNPVVHSMRATSRRTANLREADPRRPDTCYCVGAIIALRASTWLPSVRTPGVEFYRWRLGGPVRGCAQLGLLHGAAEPRWWRVAGRRHRAWRVGATALGRIAPA